MILTGDAASNDRERSAATKSTEEEDIVRISDRDISRSLTELLSNLKF